MSKRRVIEPEDYFRYQFLQDGCFSPDGKTVAYVLSHVDREKEAEFSTIWLLSVKTGETQQLTHGLSQDTAARWSPDGKKIAFLSKRGDKPQIYLIPVDGGEARALTQIPQGVGGDPVWSPDGKQIAFTAGPVELIDLNQPYRITRHVYRFDGMGNLDNAVQDIYTITVESGELRQFTQDESHNTNPVWSPNGREILFKTEFWQDSHRQEPAFRVVNLDGEVRDLVKDWGGGDTAVWTPDGEKVVFIGNPLGTSFGTQGNLWIVDSWGGEPECRTENLPFAVGGRLQPDMPVLGLKDARIFLTGDGQEAYVQVQAGGTMQVYRVSLEGPESYVPIVDGERSCLPVDMNEKQLLTAVSDLHNPLDLVITNLDGSNERQLTRVNDDFLAGLEQPVVEHLAFPSSDGVEIEGWLLKPPVGEAPYPTILYIHGGPAGGFGHIFSFDFQMLTGAGYAVLLINYRGSTGYGDEFSGMISGNLGRQEYADLMAGVDHAIEKGRIDPNRLGVCGLSYGGYLSCWIVGHTDRFKAAVPENPVTNWHSIYGVGDISPYLTAKEVGGVLHEAPDLYRNASPITYAHNCKTPTLLIQGEADHRCPAEQSEQFYTALKTNNCVVEMLRLPHMPHMGSMAGSLPARRAQNEALLDWMNRYVLGKQKNKELNETDTLRA